MHITQTDLLEGEHVSERVRVSSADFIRNIGLWQAEALRSPISITHHGRERLVLAAPELFRASENEGADEGIAVRAALWAVMENLEDAYVAFDSQLRVRALNPAAEAFAGRACDDLMDGGFIDALPPVLRAVLVGRLQRVQKRRKSDAFEFNSDAGTRLHVRVFPSGEGVCILFHNLTHEYDLTRRLEERDALEHAVRKLPGLVSIRLDPRGRIEVAGDELFRSLGFAPNDVVGHRFFDLVAVNWRRDAATLFEAVLRDREPAGALIVMMSRKGEETQGYLSLAPILADFTAQGAQALWSPTEVLRETVRGVG